MRSEKNDLNYSSFPVYGKSSESLLTASNAVTISDGNRFTHSCVDSPLEKINSIPLILGQFSVPGFRGLFQSCILAPYRGGSGSRRSGRDHDARQPPRIQCYSSCHPPGPMESIHFLGGSTATRIGSQIRDSVQSLIKIYLNTIRSTGKATATRLINNDKPCW